MTALAESIGSLAYEALTFEALLSPKPGLVDAEDAGAHADMDLSTLLASAEAIRPHFTLFAERGAAERSLDPAGRIAALRADGLAAENAMFAATGGVNAHRGAIFLLGLLCYAAGRQNAAGAAQPSAVASTAALVCRGVTGELGPSAGRAYARYGARGARGEAEAGYPNVLETALPARREALYAGASERDSWLLALLRLIGRVEDSNVLGRCGRIAANELRNHARRIADAFPSGGEPMREEIRLLNARCRAWRASPGGSADLLACARFLDSLSAKRENAPAAANVPVG